MAADFLHGVETIEVNYGGRTVKVVKSSVIALIGIAPLGAANTPILCLSPSDDAQFGQELPGFTIPQALAATRKQGPAVVVVVNTFNSVTNTDAVVTESHTITGGKLKLSAAPIGNVSVFAADGSTPWAGVKGVDYSLDAFGNFQALSSVAQEALVLKFSFAKLDAGSVTTSQIIGDLVSGVRTGIRCLELVKNQFGFKTKILIAPVFVEQKAVADALEAAADKYAGIYLTDAPTGTSIAQAIASRGPSSTNSFKSASERGYALFPHLLAYDAASDSNVAVPYSAYMAGVISRVDREEGYWVSPSNHEIKGIVGPEIPVVSDFQDPESEANLLNAAGITTVYGGFGTGTRTWGNRSLAYPANNDVKSFISIRRMADVVHESLMEAAFPYIDKPINQATVDVIRNEGNTFFNTLIGRGACTPGSKVIYDPLENPPSELAAGHITFNLEFMGPTPAERITFKSHLDINLLAQIQ